MSYGRNEVALSRGKKETILSQITATETSQPINGKGENTMILYVIFTAGAGTFSFKVQGLVGIDTWVDVYDLNGDLMGISSATATQGKLIAGIPDNFRIVATEDADGATVDVAYETFTL